MKNNNSYHTLSTCSVSTVLGASHDHYYTLENNLRDRREILEISGYEFLNDFLAITMCPQGVFHWGLSFGGRLELMFTGHHLSAPRQTLRTPLSSPRPILQ